MRLLYFGGDALSCRVYTQLLHAQQFSKRFQIKGVVTSPNSPLFRAARSSELETLLVDPAADRDARRAQWLDASKRAGEEFDLGVVFSFGLKIPGNILQSLPSGAINLHPSLLPRYRGAAPVKRALANGDQETGVSVIEVDPTAMDAGNVLSQSRLIIGGNETHESLMTKLLDVGTKDLIHVVENLQASRDAARRQPEDFQGEPVTFAPKITREDQRILWRTQDARTGFNKWRAYEEEAWSTLRIPGEPSDKIVAVVETRVPNSFAASQLLSGELKHTVEGDAVFVNRKNARDALHVRCADDSWLSVTKLRLEGRKTCSAESFVNGFKKAFADVKPRENGVLIWKNLFH